MSGNVQSDSAHRCPQCGARAEVPDFPTGQPLQCTSCGEQFFVDDQPPAPEEAVSTEEHDRLDSQRIQRIAKLRMAIHRSKSHAIIGSVLCAVVMVEFFILASQHQALVRWVNLAIAGIAALSALVCARRALSLRREAGDLR
jgi:hypothetical protein